MAHRVVGRDRPAVLVGNRATPLPLASSTAGKSPHVLVGAAQAQPPGTSGPTGTSETTSPTWSSASSSTLTASSPPLSDTVRPLGGRERPAPIEWGHEQPPHPSVRCPPPGAAGRPRGYCAGVERAIDIVEVALATYGPPVYVRKQIVHNLHVVKDLETRGAVFVDELDEVPEGATVVFSPTASPRRCTPRPGPAACG